MSFMEAYKRLEKICGEMYGNDKKLTAYIDRMESTFNGPYYVNGWREDLKQLKHYRWLRNKIAHEPNCNEEDVCQEEDEEWIDYFYSRIMNQTDPLALYAQAMKERSVSKASKTTKKHSDEKSQSSYHELKKIKKSESIYAIVVLTIIVLIVLCIILIK